MLDELVARIACGGAARSRSANNRRLTSSFSIAASMTKSAVAAAAVRSVLKVSRPKAASTSFLLRRFFSISRDMRWRSWMSARSSASCAMSVIVAE